MNSFNNSRLNIAKIIALSSVSAVSVVPHVGNRLGQLDNISLEHNNRHRDYRLAVFGAVNPTYATNINTYHANFEKIDVNRFFNSLGEDQNMLGDDFARVYYENVESLYVSL